MKLDFFFFGFGDLFIASNSYRNVREILVESYFDTSECLHPFIQINNAISSDIHKIEKILDDSKTWDWLLGKFAQGNDKFVELIKCHSTSVILIKLEKELMTGLGGNT